MPTPFKDHSGEVFGAWTVKSFFGRTKHNNAIWLCECECGTEKPVIMGSLQKGRSRSCGCKTTLLRNEKNVKHGMAGTPTYKSWHQMHQRCQGKNGHEYYLNSGITVCERWITFENFLQDMGERPAGKTLDRVDGTKGYFPENCRWADALTQANNRKTNIRQLVCGELLTPTEAARKYNKNISGIRHRMRRGWMLEAAVMTPDLRQVKKDAP